MITAPDPYHSHEKIDVTTYYRIVNEIELKNIRETGEIRFSQRDDWHPYQPNSRVFVFGSRNPRREREYVENTAANGRVEDTIYPYVGDFYLISWDDPNQGSYSTDESASGWSSLVASHPLQVRQLNGLVVERYEMSSGLFPAISQTHPMNTLI